MDNFVYVFIDESGDLGRFGSSHFVIACLTTKNPHQFDRLIKRVRQRFLKRSKTDVPELKANSSSECVRKKVLGYLNKTDANIAIIVFEKNNQDLRSKINSLYNQLVGSLLMGLEFDSQHIEIIIDKKDSNYLLRKDLDDYIKRTLAFFNKDISVRHLDSFDSKALQVVDFIAWAANRKFSFNDSSYYKIIEDKISLVKKE